MSQQELEYYNGFLSRLETLGESYYYNLLNDHENSGRIPEWWRLPAERYLVVLNLAFSDHKKLLN